MNLSKRVVDNRLVQWIDPTTARWFTAFGYHLDRLDWSRMDEVSFVEAERILNLSCHIPVVRDVRSLRDS